MEVEENGKRQKGFLVSGPKKNPARAGWPKRLGLIRATLLADFAVIGVQLSSTINEIFPCVVLSY